MTASAPSCADSANIGNVLDFNYDFSLGAADNGNVTAITNNRDTARSQSFTYDALNRLATADTQATSGTKCWGESFSYDAWANLLSIGGLSGYTGCTQESLTTAATIKNQVSGYGYDASGNMTSIPSIATYTYNAESQLTSAAGITYTYDGDGRRVKKSNGKLYWYGMGSDPLDETDLTGSTTNSAFHEYIFFGGKRIARLDSAGNAGYYFADHLGTARVVTNSAGTVLDDSDFYPFGGERPYLSSSGNNYKFTGKERDSESGLDDFGARYYSSALGRFVSADWSAIPEPVPYANLTNPQTLNLYAIVSDNPVTFADLDGHFLDDCSVCNHGDSGYSVASTPGTETGMVAFLPGEEKPQLSNSAQQQQAPQQQGLQEAQTPAPTNPDGTPKPPPVPVPGAPGSDWKWYPNPENPRGGDWKPTNWPGPGSPPAGSWDPGKQGKPGHWDIDNGKGQRQRYDKFGRPITPGQAHTSSSAASRVARLIHEHPAATVTVGAVVVVGVAALIFFSGGAAAPLAAAALAF